MNSLMERIGLNTLNPVFLETFRPIVLIIVLMFFVGLCLKRLHVPKLIIKPVIGLCTAFFVIYVIMCEVH